ncbi:MAG TPA: TolC family protein [Candidatus Acidoferrales bacterium]|nr:TolC family protein [Candidatus Acidoferrales bacterium]
MSKFRRVLISGVAMLCLIAAGTAQTPPTAPSGAPPILHLGVYEAEQLALKNNPQISVARLLSLAEHQVTREARSPLFPNAYASLTAVQPHDGSRIGAGALTNPVLYQRAAGGVTLSQLITDFGRTPNLLKSAQFREKAQLENERATSQAIVLAVDQAFYEALGAQSLLNVAQETVRTRQTVVDQVQALTRAKLKSELDLSFAQVNLSQAELLLVNAQNNRDDAFARLNTLLGFEQPNTYDLIDTQGALPTVSGTVDDQVAAAFRQRPDLLALDDQYESVERFRRAEHELVLPTISALGTAGDVPVRVSQFLPWYGAIGVNVNIPVFNGFLFSARAREADYRTNVVQQQVRDLRNRIARDVRVTYLQVQSAYQRVNVTDQLLKQANLSLDLAQTRYQLGLSSIVELSQAQLQQTEAAIGSSTARYDYRSALSLLRFQTGQ